MNLERIHIADYHCIKICTYRFLSFQKYLDFENIYFLKMTKSLIRLSDNYLLMDL